jgi:UPF0716 protein FxsA
MAANAPDPSRAPGAPAGTAGTGRSAGAADEPAGHGAGRHWVTPMLWLAAVPLLVLPWLELWLLFSLDLALPVVVLEGAVTAAVGWWFARRESLDLWTELESDVQNHRVPTEEALDAMLMVLGGWALIVPGLITDLLGAVLLVPVVRRLLVPPLRRLVRDYLI